MLQIEDASIAYGDEILFSKFNLQLKRGEIASISGSSGCGKTSLLNAILGFTPLKEGRITVNNIILDKNSIDLIRKQIAWIPQELALPLDSTTFRSKSQSNHTVFRSTIIQLL